MLVAIISIAVDNILIVIVIIIMDSFFQLNIGDDGFDLVHDRGRRKTKR